MKKIIYISLLLFTQQSFAQSSFIRYAEDNGERFAPTYSDKYGKCVGYLYNCIVEYYKDVKHVNINDSSLKKEIYIPQSNNIKTLIKDDSPIIRGVCEALVKRNLAKYVTVPQSGDIFQYWILFDGFPPSGHCGIIKKVYSDGSFDMISSYSQELDINGKKANGYSIVHVNWKLDYIKFIRLK